MVDSMLDSMMSHATLDDASSVSSDESVQVLTPTSDYMSLGYPSLATASAADDGDPLEQRPDIIEVDILPCMLIKTDKSGKIILKSLKVWEVKELEDFFALVRENIFDQIFDFGDKRYCHLEMQFSNNSVCISTFGCMYMLTAHTGIGP